MQHREFLAGDRSLVSGPVSDLVIDVDRDGPAHVVRLRGELDFDGVPKLERAFDELERAAPIRVVIDLDECDFIDSTGLATILHAADRLRAGASALRIACPEGHLRDLLRLTAIDQTIPVVGTRSEALAALGLD
jgi:anti-sigma B factor antagonist